MSTVYTINDLEHLLGRPRWAINYAMRHHGLCGGVCWFGRQRCFSESDLQELAAHFKVQLESPDTEAPPSTSTPVLESQPSADQQSTSDAT